MSLKLKFSVILDGQQMEVFVEREKVRIQGIGERVQFVRQKIAQVNEYKNKLSQIHSQQQAVVQVRIVLLPLRLCEPLNHFFIISGGAKPHSSDARDHCSGQVPLREATG